MGKKSILNVNNQYLKQNIYLSLQKKIKAKPEYLKKFKKIIKSKFSTLENTRLLDVAI